MSTACKLELKEDATKNYLELEQRSEADHRRYRDQILELKGWINELRLSRPPPAEEMRMKFRELVQEQEKYHSEEVQVLYHQVDHLRKQHKALI